MAEESCFFDKKKNIFAFKGKISEGDVNLSTENYKRQKKNSCDSKQPSKQSACLDLHDCNLKTAEEKLQEFILFCKQRKIKKIKIITGKGIHSDERGPVIKGFIQDYLNNNSNIKWKFAAPKRGGNGVFEIKLP